MMRADIFAESVVEDAAFAWLEGLGYAIVHGSDKLSGFNPLAGLSMRIPTGIATICRDSA
jgi:hypothetical protein